MLDNWGCWGSVEVLPLGRVTFDFLKQEVKNKLAVGFLGRVGCSGILKGEIGRGPAVFRV